LFWYVPDGQVGLGVEELHVLDVDGEGTDITRLARRRFTLPGAILAPAASPTRWCLFLGN
jgi:hypothetical protein